MSKLAHNYHFQILLDIKHMTTIFRFHLIVLHALGVHFGLNNNNFRGKLNYKINEHNTCSSTILSY
ncbi:hypothetical protein Lalb_Chr05g0221881 [Lupinus albus]|uniref:Uncharacterized protein n=1 Tax=Lupinus albus TaxID=3870 RepID=A0A6A4QIT8_LUPAL|nr:hypothetical protein Lalb_Chr05g0221881 [Lupinus albus]